MSRTPLRTLVAAVLASALVLAAPWAASAEEAEQPESQQVTWAVRPTDTIHGIDRPNYAYELDPGESLTDAITVTNYVDVPLTFRMYAADGFLTEAGDLDLLPAGEESTLLGSWVAMEQPEVTLEPGASADVPFTVSVPEDATPGDYVGGVLSTMVVDAAEGVSVDRRLGSRVHLRVAGDLAPALTVSDTTVSFDGGLNPFAPGTATVNYSLENTGNTRLALEPEASSSGPFGLLRVAAPGEERELLPRGSLSHTVVLEGVWPLFALWAATDVSATVISATGAPVDTEVTASGSALAPAVPWGALAVLLLLVALVLLQVRRSRRRKTAEQQRVSDAVAAALRDREGAPGTA